MHRCFFVRTANLLWPTCCLCRFPHRYTAPLLLFLITNARAHPPTHTPTHIQTQKQNVFHMCAHPDAQRFERGLGRLVCTTQSHRRSVSLRLTSAMKVEESMFYQRAILAPMVRVCSPGFRALCGAHGADVVFTEEVVAAKLATCQREVVHYPTVDTPMAEYVSYDPFKNVYKRTVVLSTPVLGDTTYVRHKEECLATPRIVLQLGVADPARGAAAALVCSNDIDGIDINMGCPKKFSVHNGFGAALMTRPELGGAIVRAVHDAVNSDFQVEARDGKRIAVSLKTRLKDTAEATVEMLRAMLTAAQHTPVNPVLHAITIHARTPDQRSEEDPLYDRAAEVVRTCRADAIFEGICWVLNGSVLSRQDGEAKCVLYGFDAAMIARAALEDARCFHRKCSEPSASSAAHDGEGQFTEVSEEYAMAIMKELFFYSMRYRTLFNNFKYHLTRVFPVVKALKPLMEKVQLELRSYADCYEFFRLTVEEKALADSCAHTMELLVEKPASSLKRSAATPAVHEEDDQQAHKLTRVETTAKAST
ncbi:dihydrouridine synthase domain protein-like protein [Leishmania tarentolae]|uniref:Dihydrouridine synthase domain protein-like protein n=1 Tax=Leishmania tarentolae TaxID=5689 RepID=A0A640L005_LEITA|nr:dihydrouridine synthase domain protein-like protein [Leishmania tarentolae]